VTVASTDFLDALKAAAEEAEQAEGQFRREIAQRVALLERERTFAYRRLNLMRAVTKAVTGAESEEAAVASALDALCDKLGWGAPSPARDEVLAQFKPVAQSVFQSLDKPAPSCPPQQAQEVDVPDGHSASEDARERAFDPAIHPPRGNMDPQVEPAGGVPGLGVHDALAAFETWYAGSHQVPFWALFDHYIPETPRVDF
jgi:hypothetical protein